MFCKTCGKEVVDEAVVCPHCGCATVEAPVEAAPVVVEAPAKKKSSGLCIAGFVVGLVSLIFGGYIGLAIGVVGLILSALGLVDVKKKGKSKKGLGIAGLVCSILTVAWTLLIIFGVLASLL